MTPLMAWQKINNETNPQCDLYKQYADHALAEYNHTYNYDSYKKYLYLNQQYEVCTSTISQSNCNRYAYLSQRYLELYKKSRNIHYYQYHRYYLNLHESCKEKYVVTGGVCGLVFEDSNANNMFDAADRRLENVSIKVTDDRNKRFMAVTNIYGEYCQDGLHVGKAFVNILNSSLPKNFVQVIGSDQTEVTIVANKRIIEENNGYVLAKNKNLGAICGIVFEDTNLNSELDRLDRRLENIAVKIKDSSGKKTKVFTNTKGRYCFKNLPSGRAVVNIMNNTLPDGFVQVVGTDKTVVTILANQRIFEENNGYINSNNDAQFPVADAGEDYNGSVGDLVSFDASKSYVSNGNIVSYVWRKGSTILSTEKIFSLSTLPAGIHSIILRVTDNQGNNATDTKRVQLSTDIVVENIPPVANAGEDINATVGENVTFDGSQSYDSDGSIVGYIWSEGTTSLSAEKVFALNTLSVGIHTLVLSVTDNDSATSSDTIEVLIRDVIPPSPVNSPPVANAGKDVNVSIGEDITFDASLSFDPDGSIASYQWKNRGKLLSNEKIFTINGLAAGSHAIELIVTDNSGQSSSDELLVRIASNNILPTVKIKNTDFTMKENEKVLILADVNDPDGYAVTYVWKIDNIDKSNKEGIYAENLSLGEHTISLTVIDRDKGEATDSITVTVIKE